MLKSVILAPLFIFCITMLAFLGVDSMEQERFAEKQRIDVFYTLSNVQTRLEAAAWEQAQWLESFCSLASRDRNISPDSLKRAIATLPRDVSETRSIEIFSENRLFWSSSPGLQRLSGLEATSLLHQKTLAIAQQFPEATTPVMIPPYEEGQIRNDIAFIAPIFVEGTAGPDDYWGFTVMMIDSRFLLRQAGVLDSYKNIRVAIREFSHKDSKDFIFGSPTIFDKDAVRLDAHVPGGIWELAAVPRLGWHRSPYAGTVRVIGSLLVFMSTFVAWLIARQLQLREQARKEYRHLVHNARTIILRFDTTGRITFMNDYGLEFFGYSEDQLIGKPLIGTILPTIDLSGNDMRRMLVHLIDDPGEFLFHENENMLRNGDRVWIAWANKAITRRNRLQEILAVGTDITERRRFEDALRESEEKHRMLAENVTDVIWGLDANLNFTYISPSDRQLRGYPREEVLGKPLWDFVAPGSRQSLLDSVTELEQAEQAGEHPNSLTMTLELTCKNGGTVWVETLCTILYSDEGRFVGVQGVSRDITDRIRIQALREDVERMARHDLKTPLSAVIGLPEEIARNGNLTDRQQEMLDVIAKAGTSMLELVNRSLDLHKMETETYELERTPVDILQLIDQIRAEIRGMAAQKAVSFALDTGGRGYTVMGEEVLLHTMLSNLMKNAIEASPEGSAVSITLAQSGPNLQIILHNKGGVPASLRETFFEKYSRHGNSKGSGLGTYSARLVARTHGGDIHLNAEKNGETTITVFLPLH